MTYKFQQKLHEILFTINAYQYIMQYILNIS